MADGIDLTQDDLVPYQLINKIKNSFSSATAPTNPQEGMRWWDSGNSVLKTYNGASWDTLSFLNGECPVGGIIGWVGGYFGDGSNGSYTRVLGSANTVAGANGYMNSLGYYVCDGAAPNDSDSPIFNSAAKYLAELTDDRFFMGDTTISGVKTGGANTRAHTHQVDIAEFDSGGPSNTTTAASGGTQMATNTHTHKVNPAETQSGAASNDENRPKYLAMFYAVRIK